MTTDEVLAALADIGVTLTLIQDNRVELKRRKRPGEPPAITPLILKALRWHRREIVKRLGGNPDAPIPEPPRLREWQWPGGMIVQEEPHYCSVGDLTQNPGLAVRWRYQGDEAWQTIAGRETEATVTPTAQPHPTEAPPESAPAQGRLFSPSPV